MSCCVTIACECRIISNININISSISININIINNHHPQRYRNE